MNGPTFSQNPGKRGKSQHQQELSKPWATLARRWTVADDFYMLTDYTVVLSLITTELASLGHQLGLHCSNDDWFVNMLVFHTLVQIEAALHCRQRSIIPITII